ncbi:hypothetical protein Tco_0782080 [Tanacetum coccineum]
MTPPPAMVPLIRVSSSSSPRIASLNDGYDQLETARCFRKGDGGPSIKEWADLFLEAQDRMKKRALAVVEKEEEEKQQEMWQRLCQFFKSAGLAACNELQSRADVKDVILTGMYAFKMLLIELCLEENQDELRLLSIYLPLATVLSQGNQRVQRPEIMVSSNDYSAFDSMLIRADYLVPDFKRTVQAQDGAQ